MAQPLVSTKQSYQLEPKRKSRLWTWFVRLFQISALLVILAAIAHGIWGWHEGKKLQELLAQYQAAGEPVSVADFASAPVPDEQNAAVVLRQAALSIDEKSDVWEAFEAAEETAAHPLTEKELKAYRQIVAAHAAALEAPAEAARRPQVDWGIVWTSPIIATVEFKHLNQQRLLARLLVADAMLAQHDNDHARALRRADELLLLSRLVDQPSTLITHLVSIGLSAMASDVVVKTSHNMTLTSAGGKQKEKFAPLRREQVTAMIATLLDTTAMETGRRQLWLAERMTMIDAMQCFANGQLAGFELNATPTDRPKSNMFGGYVLRPIALGDARFMAEIMTRAREAAVAVDLPSHQALTSAGNLGADPGRGRIFARILLPSFGRAIEQDYKGMSDRRMAAIALGYRLYTLDHDGNTPATLAELAPKYLPAVPLDPMTAGQPIGYRRDLEIIYSVGSDLRDDGGYEPPPEASRAQVREKSDDVRHLKRPERRMPEATLENETPQSPENEPGPDVE